MSDKFNIDSLRDVPPVARKELETELSVTKGEHLESAVHNLYHAVQHGDMKECSYKETRDANGAKAEVIEIPKGDQVILALAAVALAAPELRPGDVQRDPDGKPLITPGLLATAIVHLTNRHRADEKMYPLLVGMNADFRKRRIIFSFAKKIRPNR